MERALDSMLTLPEVCGQVLVQQNDQAEELDRQAGQLSQAKVVSQTDPISIPKLYLISDHDYLYFIN